MSHPPIDSGNPIAKALAASAKADRVRLGRGAEALQAEMHPDGVLFTDKLPGKGGAVVVFTWPGVLMMRDPIDGKIIREASAAEMWAEMPKAAHFMARRKKGAMLLWADFQPPQGKRLRASIWPDGVVRVRPARGGELLAESEPGRPHTLRAGFRTLTAQYLAPRID